jgi:uncharacterized protein DUF4396
MHAHSHHSGHGAESSLNRTAALATLHCLTGCAIGEVLGMVVGTAFGWSNAATIALSIVLAFGFGYSLTMLPLLRAGLALAVAVPLAFASDTFSIAVMEIVDNGIMLGVPGAMDSALSSALFWGALALSLAVAYVFAFPVNRYLIARGQGHAVVHAYHGHGAPPEPADAGGAPSSPRGLILTGLAAIAVTIGVATGGAMIVEARHEDSTATGHAMGAGDAPAHGGGATVMSGLSVSEGGYTLAAADTTLATGHPRQFSFRVLADDGAPAREFEQHGGVRMHLIVVRRDLGGYQHLHPLLRPDGSWRTRLTLPEAGVYRAFADFERNGEKTVLGVDLFAAGRFQPKPLPAPAARVEVDGYSLELDGRPRAGEDKTLTYRIRRNGELVDVEPYLGAGGHLVALRAGDLAYLHVHPLAERRGVVSFAATFPTAGAYRLFLQFRDRGGIHTAPLTIDVERGR